jgi:hypothetical protein
MMTAMANSAMPRKMGRKKLWPERTAVKFAAGTFERIAKVLVADEDRTDFFRKSVEREIERREAAQKRQPKRKQGRRP